VPLVFIIKRREALDSYLLLKLIHILSAVVVAGTGIGIAFFMFMANRSSNVAAIAVTARHVVLADWVFTTPAVVALFVSGMLLMLKLGYFYMVFDGDVAFYIYRRLLDSRYLYSI
jgi:uncharacterized membrane protein